MLWVIILQCLSISCVKEVEKYDSLTIARVDTIKIFKDQMEVVYKYTYNHRIFLAKIDMNLENMIPKNFPVYVRFSSNFPEKYLLLLKLPVALNDSLNVSYIQNSTGSWTYKIKRNGK